MDEDELFVFAKNIHAPFSLVQEVAKTGRLPVVNFAAGGIATPADAALMMQLGVDGERQESQTIIPGSFDDEHLGLPLKMDEMGAPVVERRKRIDSPLPPPPRHVATNEPEKCTLGIPGTPRSLFAFFCPFFPLR